MLALGACNESTAKCCVPNQTNKQRSKQQQQRMNQPNKQMNKQNQKIIT
jgi:transcription initiation factor TFIID subunit TAF12